MDNQIDIGKKEIDRLFYYMFELHMDEGWSCEETMDTLNLLITQPDARDEILEEMETTWAEVMKGVI